MIYLLDTNTFIEANNRYYGMTFCPAYWAWIERSHQANLVRSIQAVSQELLRGDDQLAEWAKQQKSLFMSNSDSATQAAFAEVAKYVSEQASQMKTGALEDFLAGADPWLIAKAMTLPECILVTHEQFNLQVRRKYTLPNVCRHFGVQWADTFEMLTRSHAVFELKV
jgi:hypothetical protein